MDDLGLVQPVDRLGQGVVVGVALAAHRGLDASFCQALGVANADVLRPSVGMVRQCAIPLRLPGVQGLLQGIQNKVRVHGTAHPPTHNAPGVHVDDKGHVQPALPGRDIGEVRDPELIGPIGFEDPIDPVQRTRRLHVADRGSHHLAAAHALQPQALHQPLHRAARNAQPLPIHLLPNLVCAVDASVGLPHTLNLLNKGVVSLCTSTAQMGVALTGGVAPVT